MIVEYVIPVISSGLCDTTGECVLVCYSMISLFISLEYTKATVRVVTLTGIISSHREIATKTFPLLLNMLHKIGEGLCVSKVCRFICTYTFTGLYCSDNVDLAVTVCIAIQSMLKCE